MKFERTLALTDLSPDAGTGLLLADSVAGRFGGQVVVGVLAHEEAATRDAASRHISRVIHAERRGVFEFAPPGDVLGAVEHLVQRFQPDALCLSSPWHPPRGAEAEPNLAMRLANTLRVPMFVNAGTPLPPRGEPLRVALGTSLSLPTAHEEERLARLLRAADVLHLVHVLEPQVYYPRTRATVRAMTAEERLQLRKAAAMELASVVVGPGGPDVGVHVFPGRPADELRRFAAGLGCHMLVVGTQATPSRDPASVGSICRELLGRCGTPLLVEPPDPQPREPGKFPDAGHHAGAWTG